jgi:NTP pyrophosphatase (non-canonical NTP hydrolase)
VPGTSPLIRILAAKMLQGRLLTHSKTDALAGRGPESDSPLRTCLSCARMTKLPATSFADSTAALLAFRNAREWKQFHTPRQLAAALAIEASELQQTMLWKTDTEVEVALGNTDFMVEVGDELADVLSFTLLLAHDLGLDPAKLIEAKLKKNEERYPVEKSRGRSTKYTTL